MKINLKNKIMLAVLAGGMLCANGALAENWYGTNTPTANKWTIDSGNAVTSGLTLTVADGETADGNALNTAINIYGGYTSGTEDVKNNSITFNTTDTTSALYVYGGYSENGGAKNNKVTVKNGIINSQIYGGLGKKGTVEGNSVTINNGTLTNWIYGGKGDNGYEVKGNSVIVNGGTITKAINGGNGSGNVTGNKVVIEEIFGNVTFSGSGIIGGNVSGASSNATENEVTIKGGTFSNSGLNIYGASSGGDAKDNIVNIEGGTFTNGFKLYGGKAGSSKVSSGNTLNLKIKMGGKAAEVGYFQTMNFTLPSNITKNDIMLSTANVTYDNTLIGVTAKTGVKLNKDEVIYLIKSENAPIGTISNDGAYVLDGAAIVKLDGNNLILTLLQDFEQKEPDPPEPPARNTDEEKAPVEAIAATAAMINQSADLAMGEGLQNLLENTSGKTSINIDREVYKPSIETFGAITATRSKYKTGSHVDMDGWGFLVGAGNTRNWKNGEKTTYGLFFEYGKGDFDTYNNDIHGEGDSNNKGVGIIARHTLNNNTYFDANVRYGKQETEWSESEIGGYDTDSRYYGAAVGLGHVYPLENNDELDIYARYSFGHVGACDAKVKDSDYHFDRVLSQRIRLGAKYNFVQKNNKAKPYVGMAWERELKGESKATITGIGEAPAPSLKGNTGIFEIGCDWDTGKWSLGAGANAYIGKRKGWGGMFNAFYNF